MSGFLPEHCRGARALLDWSQEKLAEAAGVSRSTIRDFEARRHELHRTTAQQIVHVLKEAGVVLLEPDSMLRLGAGVRLREPPPASST